MKTNKLEARVKVCYVNITFETTLIVITRNVMSIIKPLHLFGWRLVTHPGLWMCC